MRLSFILSIIYFIYISSVNSNKKTKYGCTLDLDDPGEWPEQPPILTNEIGDLVLPEGVKDNRHFTIEADEVLMLGCPETQFESWPDETLLFAQCIADDERQSSNWRIWTEDGEEWFEKYSLGEYSCSRQPDETVTVVGNCGPDDEGTEILVEFDISSTLDGEGVTMTICHDLKRSSTLWSRHTLWDEISAGDHGNSGPSFRPDGFFDFDVNYFYKMATQHETIADLVGSQDLADEYIQAQNTNLFLSRGHLAPNADFLFYSWMDATYHFINVAPQWQSFNGANWGSLENHARNLVIEREIDLVVYTGTHSVLQLADVNGDMVDIYLYNKNQLPVPRYYWKILHDPFAGSGVAIIGINNPHLSSIPESFILCPPLESHTLVDSINDPTDIKKGYMWACRVEDLASAVPEVPPLPSMSLLE